MLEDQANEFLEWLKKEAGSSYFEPNQNEFYNELLYEWWHKDRKLSLYFVENEEPVIIRIWGPDIDDEMFSHNAYDYDLSAESWKWLKNVT